ncbi:MAG TPA: S46 family peptidase [Bacteroidales bacterium]|nr:S46 family peptidase [Bacteroidales bacterium]HOH22372.1 S46 family peptidase [Bacteroidales bacterium]HPB58229.1 S46 family peptidase [Bacteroidales bacterium]HPZ03035.1 S46 family peptidase [Bacteroidales bacterium]HQB75032.1 S46 family peptidase [Bacteroidales bacterium]
MKRVLFLIGFLSLFLYALADGGMWVPLLLQKNEAEMQQMGFKLTAEDIYSINHSGLKDAVVLFGRGCTAELISPNGLLLTNHHCGYSYIQRYSTMENNYLHDGFWAQSYEEEIHCAGLEVSFLVRMEDVTEAVMKDVDLKSDQNKQDIQIATNIEQLIKESSEEGKYRVNIKPLYYGNQYYMYIYKVYSDVRLVGTPPETIGKFGGDTDNWVWPRHTGDFSLYRIYTAPNGEPAAYSKENIPMNSPHFLPISTKGIEEGDFTMVIGYPGRTMQYYTSDGVDLVVNYRNPPAITQRGKRLDIMKKYMAESAELRLMYAAKANSISNGWKKWIGENQGIQNSNVIEVKKQQEKALHEKIKQNPTWNSKYGTLLQDIESEYSKSKQLEYQAAYLRETFTAVELPGFVEKVRNILESQEIGTMEMTKEKLLALSKGFYPSFYKPIDKEIFVALLHHYFNVMPQDQIPDAIKDYYAVSLPTLKVLSEELYERSVFSSQEQFEQFVNYLSAKKIKKLERWLNNNQLFKDALAAHRELQNNQIPPINANLDQYYKLYLQCLMDVEPERVLFPDANLTMRVAYGKMLGIAPIDGIYYLPYTTSDGILQKEDPDHFDYQLDARLKELLLKRDFGKYADKEGNLRVAFIAANHTTGGNSGSPILNGNGELVGINFDRMWEGTMSDLYYDVNQCRNISVDVRYILYIIDYYANAQNLIKEMQLR